MEGNTPAPEEQQPVRIPVAPRAVRRACAKQGHQRKGDWDQCAECGATL